MEDANNANAGMYVSGSVCFGGEDLLRSVTKRTVARMNKMTGKGDSKVNPKVSTSRLDANLGGNDQDVGGVASYPDVRRSNYTNTNPNVSEYPSLVKHSNVLGNDGFQPGFDSDGTRNASSFCVPLNSLKEIDAFTKDLEVGKYDLWLELTKEARSRIIDIISNRWDTFLNMQKSALIVDDSLSGKVSPSDPIAQAVDIKKSTSYVEAAGASAKDQPKVNSNFRPLVANPVFKGVNIGIDLSFTMCYDNYVFM
ncbi:hypothetical protein Tco_0709112 [Tanacetum coccineum]